MPSTKDKLSKRGGEIRNFCKILRNPKTLQETDVPEHFGSLMRLAIGDYGINAEELAAALEMNPMLVADWGTDEDVGRWHPEQEKRARILDYVASKLEDEFSSQNA